MLINLKQPREAIARPLTIITLCCVPLIFAASLSSSVYLEYVYDYEVSVGSGNTGFKLKAKANLEVLYVEQATDSGGGTGGGGSGSGASVTSNLIQPNELLVRLRLTDPVYYSGGKEATAQPLVFKNPSLHNPNYDLYARISTLSNGTAQVKELFTHKLDATTYKNIKKSILLNLLPTNHHLNPNGANELNNDHNKGLAGKKKQPLYYYSDDHITIQPICTHDNNQDQPELFSPDSISSVHIIAKARDQSGTRSSTAASRARSNNIVDSNGEVKSIQQEPNGLTLFQTIDGYQNVTFKSRVFAHAESELTTDFHLSLVKEIDARGHERYDSANSISQAIKLLDLSNYEMDSTQLERERKICSTHHCGRSLAKLVQDYNVDMHDESMASIDAAVAFLRILNRLRETKGSSVDDIMKVLEAASRSNSQGFESSLLDVLTAARTKNSIAAVLKYIKLAKQSERNLPVAERFLSTLSVVAKTTAKMRHKRPLKSPYYFTATAPLKRGKQARESQSRMASLEFITKEFLSVIEGTPSRKWKSQKLRWSSLLTLATLVNSYNQERDINPAEDELNLKVSKLLIQELQACKKDESDCRIVALQAIGNIGYLSDDQFQVIRQQILESGKRESVTATKVLRDLLQNQPKDQQLSDKFFTQLKDLLLRVVYDSTAETTSRVLASEMIVRFLPSSVASEELLRHLPSFGNNELATMIYSRMQSLRPDSLERYHENWYWKSCIINGTSTSFVRTMAETKALNASYGVNVEMNKAKILKESSFDVFLDTKQRTQDIFSLGIFVRGVSSFVGSSDAEGSESDHDESTMAGMTLRLLGGYLRPLVFFSNMGELMGHVWAGTVSEPTTAFNGNLLLIDHDEGYPLISGFVAEQQMRGVLSIDVSGQASVSIWNRNSKSVVKTKAAVTVQASQSVFTSHDDLWQGHLFSFGGNAMIDFIADVEFAHMPVKVCLQVTQPNFAVRYNSRRHDQMATETVRRKITRRHFQIGSKSYPLNSENNKMCAAMNEGL